MPLSDREKRLLEEMEAALLTEDPRLVSALSSKAPVSPSRNRIMVAAGLVLLGLITLFAGLISQITPVGILGFLFADFSSSSRPAQALFTLIIKRSP
jgi:hypothetical protein